MFSFGTFFRVWTLSKHYLFSMKRNPARLIEVFLWPAIELVFFSFLSIEVSRSGNNTQTLSESIVLGVLIWNFFGRVIQEVVSQFMDDVSSRNIINILVSPISLLELSLSLILSSLLKMSISLVLLMFIILIINIHVLFSVGTLLFVCLGLLLFFASTLSLVAIGLILIFGTRLGFIGWFISLTVQIFSCVFYSRDILPGILYYTSFIVPSSYFFESLRQHIQGKQFDMLSFSVGITLLLLYFIIAVVFFDRSYRYAARTGQIVKL